MQVIPLYDNKKSMRICFAISIFLLVVLIVALANGCGSGSGVGKQKVNPGIWTRASVGEWIELDSFCKCDTINKTLK